MSRIYKKTNFAGSDSLTGIAFGGGGGGGGGGFWSRPDTICSGAANATTYGFSTAVTTVASIGGGVVGSVAGPAGSAVGVAVGATAGGAVSQLLSGDIYDAVYNDCMMALDK